MSDSLGHIKEDYFSGPCLRPKENKRFATEKGNREVPKNSLQMRKRK